MNEKKIFNLRNNKRVQAAVQGCPTPDEVSPEEQINHSVCSFCGAELPSDVSFQEYHIWKEHGLVV